MHLDFPTQTIFYSIEKAIKQYRKYSQNNIAKHLNDITVDHALILIIIDKNPEFSQVEIAEMIFKDYASITRMVDLMVKNTYLERAINTADRRRFKLRITSKGYKAIETLVPTIKANREQALKGITEEEIMLANTVLKKIITNCPA